LRGSEGVRRGSGPSSPKEGYAGHASSSAVVAAPRVAEGEAWWSQAGSNRRPRHCERRALPAELWPHRDRVDISDGGQQSAPFTIRAKVKSRTAKSLFSGDLPGTSLVCAGGNRYLAGSRIRDRTPRVSLPCVPSSTSFLSFWISMSGC